MYSVVVRVWLDTIVVGTVVAVVTVNVIVVGTTVV